MIQDPRILNISRGFRLKRNQALRAIEACSCVWVEIGVSVRDVTLKEAIELRNEQARQREPLAFAELPGVIFRPPEYAIAADAKSRHLAFEARKYAVEAVS